MNATLAAVVLSLVSAVAYASAAVAQSRLAERTEPDTGVLALLGRGAWWAAVGLNATGAALHVAALAYGPLTLVQPLGALTLVAAVPLGARAAGRRVSRTEWQGTALTLVGLAALLTAAGGAAPHRTLSTGEVLAVGAVTLAAVAGLCRPGTRPGLRHAAASGITSGVASALTQTLTVALTGHGSGSPFGLRLVVVAVLVAGFAAGGLLLSQTAYRGGLGAPLATLTLANPLAAAAIGMILLGERLHGGAVGVLAALVGGALAVRGVTVLSRAQERSLHAAAPAGPPTGAPARHESSAVPPAPQGPPAVPPAPQEPPAADAGPAPAAPVPSRVVIAAPRPQDRTASGPVAAGPVTAGPVTAGAGS
ncbi:DMT family transporter [uncultured Streptomyces sp.]|uniref:DMT family transporter n=1 Tax=uncultured Streptomyces sp. TaxID=174707 RepID=UPI002629D33C|nr:DMT family transporter [uncultured Streptomyces sp.]